MLHRNLKFGFTSKHLCESFLFFCSSSAFDLDIACESTTLDDGSFVKNIQNFQHFSETIFIAAHHFVDLILVVKDFQLSSLKWLSIKTFLWRPLVLNRLATGH